MTITPTLFFKDIQEARIKEKLKKKEEKLKEKEKTQNVRWQTHKSDSSPEQNTLSPPSGRLKLFNKGMEKKKSTDKEYVLKLSFVLITF